MCCTPAPPPSLTAGVMQVNARIPAGVPSGDALVTVAVGSAASQSGITLIDQIGGMLDRSRRCKSMRYSFPELKDLTKSPA